jgi:transcriptional regulator MraZ
LAGQVGDAVALFLSTFVNKVDRKGRVSVPATFRATLAGQSFLGIVAYRSFKLPCVEGCGIDHMEAMSARVDNMGQFSDSSDNVSVIFSDSQQLPFDGEGRIMLPQGLAEYAGITEHAAFVGQGKTFQVWEPERFKAHQAELRERARRQGVTLPPPPGDRR